MAALTIEARDPATAARAGRLGTAHGDVRTPAFVPLATKATVKGLLPEEVKALGYEMVLGNTFHLLLNPGAELIERFGGLHGFMGWDGPIITDSGGFQVFSMGHGTVADEIKSRSSRAGQSKADAFGESRRAGPARGGSAGGEAAKGAVAREGLVRARGRFSRSRSRACAFAPTWTAPSAFSAPRTRWRCRQRFARTSRSCSTSAPPSTSIAPTPSARPSALTAGWSAAWLARRAWACRAAGLRDRAGRRL